MAEYGQVYWCKLDDQWYQKFFYAKADRITVTYHCGSKCKPSCQVIELKVPQSDRYCGLKLIEKDLRDIKLYLREYEKLLNVGNENSIPNNTSFESLLAKALLTTIVVHYIRCFPGSKGRKALLQESDISDSNIDTHRLLMELRNTYLAHSDASKYEGCTYVILTPPKNRAHKDQSRPVKLVELFQTIGIEELINDVGSLINELHDKIHIQIKKSEDSIGELLSKLSLEKSYKFLKGKGKRVKVSLAELRKLVD